MTELTKKVQIEPIGEAVLNRALSPTQLDSPNLRLDSSSDKHGIMKDILEGQSYGGQEASDIIALLSKAQREYNEGHNDSSPDDGNNNNDTNIGNNNDDNIHSGPVSISVSSLFANAKGKRRTQGVLDEDSLTGNDQALTNDNPVNSLLPALAQLAS